MPPSKRIDGNYSVRVGPSDLWEAPGSLEVVRTFLNTERLTAGDSAVRRDALPQLLTDRGRWNDELGDLPFAGEAELDALGQLREDLRFTLGDERGNPNRLAKWLNLHPIRVSVTRGVSPDEITVLYGPETKSGAVESILMIVVESVASGTWARLKICPDCRWAFYDHTRSRTKVWCRMEVGSGGGRGCGSIQKTRRYRASHSQDREEK
jgi:predicted RNA-binding Zn ribbon-like protein